MATSGVILYSSYPYTGTESTCASSGKSRVFTPTYPGYTIVGTTYSAYKTALTIEPINISFAVGDDFLQYKSGIYGTNARCDTYLNHAM